jgi:hypothetical protein
MLKDKTCDWQLSFNIHIKVAYCFKMSVSNYNYSWLHTQEVLVCNSTYIPRQYNFHLDLESRM